MLYIPSCTLAFFLVDTLSIQNSSEKNSSIFPLNIHDKRWSNHWEAAWALGPPRSWGIGALPLLSLQPVVCPLTGCEGADGEDIIISTMEVGERRHTISFQILCCLSCENAVTFADVIQQLGRKNSFKFSDREMASKNPVTYWEGRNERGEESRDGGKPRET